MPSDAPEPRRHDVGMGGQLAEHLRRLARFALVDGIPTPWGMIQPVGFTDLRKEPEENE